MPHLQQADITYGNLEIPLASGINKEGQEITDPGFCFDGQVYSGFPRFNAHPCLAEDLVASGFDILSTANNHALDRHGIGADRTIDTLRQAGIQHTGTRKRNQRGDRDAWCTIVEKNGLKTAWIGCTYGTNEVPDPQEQVLHWIHQTGEVLDLVRRWRDRVDAVFVTPHWGEEYQPLLLKSQVWLAQALLEQGALAVIGNHPHIVQPMQCYKTQDGRHTLVAHSLGNFVSAQPQVSCRATVILRIELIRNPRGTIIHGVSVVPAYMDNSREEGHRPQLRPIEPNRPYGQEGVPHILKPLGFCHGLEGFDKP